MYTKQPYLQERLYQNRVLSSRKSMLNAKFAVIRPAAILTASVPKSDISTSPRIGCIPLPLRICNSSSLTLIKINKKFTFKPLSITSAFFPS
jgi:hypothetical protein